ncbi:MAG: hypothetical protein BRC38_01825 [Cyanobacteria bacterium QH_6_48_35]|nr:MAG: hypothetical protein BRC38_01825 [Cyanobacteria bacterium QH_6_48_35]
MKQFGIICHKYLITEKNLNRKYKFPKKIEFQLKLSHNKIKTILIICIVFFYKKINNSKGIKIRKRRASPYKIWHKYLLSRTDRFIKLKTKFPIKTS